MLTTIELSDFLRELGAGLNDSGLDSVGVKLSRLTQGEMQNLGMHVYPNIKTVKATINDNMQVVLPYDCEVPIQICKLVRSGNDYCVYPLGKRDQGVFIEPTFGCEEDPEPSETQIYFPGYNDEWLNYSCHYYGEYYPYAPTIFFGFWEADLERVYFQSGGCVYPGASVLIKYRALGDYCTVPADFKEVLKYKVLVSFWENTDPRKARSFLDMFQRAHKMWKKTKLSKWSYDDYINAFVNGVR